MIVFWDSSALAKRYTPEPGNVTVDKLFEMPHDMAVAVSAFAETYSVIVRKRNARIVSDSDFQSALVALTSEILDDPDFLVLDVESSSYLSGLKLIKRHNINASDAAMLATYLQHARAATQLGEKCLFIVTDRKLRRAAEAEGLPTLDPEGISPSDAEAMISS